MQRERVLGKKVDRPSVSVRGRRNGSVRDISHVYMGSVSEKGVQAWAPSSVMMSGYGDIVQAALIGGMTPAPIPN
jgi:hypothetical protein